jgi:hypothetical protein
MPFTIGKRLESDNVWTEAADCIIDEVRISNVAIWPVGRPANRSIISVLHVSAFSLGEAQQVINIANASSYFDVTQVGLYAFNDGVPNDLSEYDAIVFGISNRYEQGSYNPYQGAIGRISELRSYVENGGGVVWTHDSLELDPDDCPDAEIPAGVDLNSTYWPPLQSTVNITIDHGILHYPFEIGTVNDTIQVQTTHTTGGNVVNATVVIRFVQLPSESYNFYLTAHEYYAGRVAVTELGDTMIEYN